MANDKTAVLHYTAPPVVGGVEAVIEAQVRSFVNAGFPVTVIAGNGNGSALPEGCELVLIPEMDTRHPDIMRMSAELEQGRLPNGWDRMVETLTLQIRSTLRQHPNWIVHNIFTKHFNLPLTSALIRLLDDEAPSQCVAWCHDISWTSPGSSGKVHPGFPWDLLRTYREDLTYVAVSKQRQEELAGLFGCPAEEIHVIYNGVDLQQTLGLSRQGVDLIYRLGILEAYPVLLMPVRVTRAKNIELAIDTAVGLRDLGTRPKVVITGPPDPHSLESMAYFEELIRYREKAGVEQEVRFVYESGPEPGKPFTIPAKLVWELMRACDAVLMTSDREGFGMPVLEAGIAGVPVIARRSIPAVREIAVGEVLAYPDELSPQLAARQILSWLDSIPTSRLRRKVKTDFLWENLFERQIRPLLRRTEPEH